MGDDNRVHLPHPAIRQPDLDEKYAFAHTRALILFIKQLPWIYHTCHRQLEGDCKVNAGSCGKYRVFKECCCDRETKLEGRSITSTPRHYACIDFFGYELHPD
uniref:CCC domain-containing protein n=1 Tax=Anopheles minimus TaxID=112268 RepID=A0A182VWJ5_9DIPT